MRHEIGTPISDVVDRMIESGHSRLPVYREALDHIEGLVYARDLLKILNDPSDDSTMLTDEMLREPIFIPETKTLEELLTEFQETRVHIAIVIDEYGGAEGIVTSRTCSRRSSVRSRTSSTPASRRLSRSLRTSTSWTPARAWTISATASTWS